MTPVRSPRISSTLGLLTALLPAAPLGAQTAPPAAATAPVELRFGLYSFKKPTDVYRSFMVAIDDLDASMSKALGQPVVINLKIYKTYDECLDHFVAGDVDFVRFGPASYVLAKQRQDKIQLLVAEKEDIADNMSGIIAVRSGSPIRSLADLKGRKFAFGDENSTIGRYLAQAELIAAGIHAADLAGFKYLDRHDKVFKAVEIGDFDAGALHYATYQENNRNGQLRELARFRNVGKPWIARAGLEPRLVEGLRQSLLGVSDPKVLDALSVSGFVKVVDKDFEVIRDSMKKSEEFLQTAAAPRPVPGKD
jgi:phosphonate transport system substrate-binding protein